MYRKKISFDRLFERSYWQWRANPSIMVPTMLTNAAQVAVQAVLSLILILALSQLAVKGTIKEIGESLSSGNLEGIMSIIKEPSVISVLIPAAILAAILGAVVYAIGFGMAASAEFGVYSKLLNSGSVALGDVVYYFWSRWRGMAWTTFVVLLVTYGPFGIGLSVLVLSLLLTPSSGLFLVLLGSLIFLFSSIWLAVTSFATVYVYPVVTLDNISGLRAVRRSFAVARRFKGATLTYGAVRLLSQAILVGLAISTDLVGAPIGSIVAVVMGLFLTPILHLTKTWIFRELSVEKDEGTTFSPTPSILADLRRYVPRTGWAMMKIGIRELGRFTLSLRNLPYHLASAASFMIGTYVGGEVSSRGLAEAILAAGYPVGKINPEFSRAIPPFLGVDLFFHNWEVSLATALSGVFFVVPVFLTLTFNGFLLGVLSGLVPNQTMFLVAIMPHGIIELPALILAGSCGLSLGLSFMRALRQEKSSQREYLYPVFRRAVFIVVGLIPLFFVAGVIESVVTPIVMRMFGWT